MSHLQASVNLHRFQLFVLPPLFADIASVDTLTLARNARTSPEMIDRFYAAPLQGEMNVGELQSKRRPRPWE